MATLITKNSSTASAVPAAGDLVKGELAVNVTDKKVYTKDNSAAVVKLVGSLGNQEANAVAITGGTINGTTIGATTPSTGAFTTASASGGFTGNLTGNVTGNVSGTAANVTGVVAIANGGTGLSSLGTGVQSALGQAVTGSGSFVLSTSPSLTTPNLGTPSAAVLTNATGLPLTTGVTGTLGVANGGTGITAFGTGVATALGQNVTGSGGIVLATSPSLTTPNLGTPSAATLTNATGLPISTGVSGLGTNVATALAVNVGTAGAFVVNGGALGTPSSGTLTNCTGYPTSALSGSINLATQVTGTLATTNGGTGLTSFTANGVVYASSTSALTTGSALTFDGNRFAVSASGLTEFRIADTGSATDQKNWTWQYGTGIGAGVLRLRAGNDANSDGQNAYILTRTGINVDSHQWLASGSEQMRLTSTGLGIGTSSPAFKLDVNGNVNIGSTSSVDTALFVKSSTVTGLVGAQSNYSAWSSGGLTTAMNIGTTTNNGISFGTNNIGRLNLDSSGNLGLGVTPSAWGNGRVAFDVKSNGAVYSGTNMVGLAGNAYDDGSWKRKATAGATLYEASSQHAWYVTGSGSAGSTISWTQAMTLDASGNLGVGTTSPTDTNGFGRALDLNGPDGAAYYARANGSSTNYTYFGNYGADGYIVNRGAGIFYFINNNTERARITSGGYFKASNTGSYRGSTDAYHEFRTNGSDWTMVASSSTTTAANCNGVLILYSGASPNGTGNNFLYCSDSTAGRFELRSNGGLANFSANDVNLSDRREKTNFAPAKSYLDTICAIPVQTFNYIDQSEDDPGLTLGVVAQDVQAVAPELVMESDWSAKKDGSKMRLSIYQTDLQYALMKCIQELKAQNDDLRARVAQLEAK